MSYHTNLIQLAAIDLLRKSNEDVASEDNNQNFQGVLPLSSFLYLISLVDMVSVPLTEGNIRNFARSFPTEISIFLKTLLESLGNPTKAAQLKIIAVILQGVTPLIYFSYLISLVGGVSVPLTQENNQNFARGSHM